MAPGRVLARLVLVPAFMVTACSGVEDAVSDAASEAGMRVGCEAARAALDEGRTLVDDAAAQVGADPEAARRELTAIGEALDVAREGLGGKTRAAVDRAGAAVEDLRAQAQAVADGARVDDRVLTAAQKEYDAATAELTELC